MKRVGEMGRGVYICMLGKVVYVWMKRWWLSGEGRGGRVRDV